LALDLVSMTLHEVHVTGADQGESLSRYGFTQGDVVMVDRGYNHPATIIDLYEQEVGVVVRLLPTAMPLYLRPADQPESALPAALRLNMADYLRAATGDCVSIPVWLSSKGRSCPGMVHAQRLPPEAAEAARRRCRQDGNRKGRTPAQDTLYLAGWVMVFTTVPEDIVDGSAIIKLYRTRWQIELAFKRLKSLLDLDLLRTKQDSLVGKLWITGKLLYAVVIERHLHKRFGHNWNRLDQVRMTTPWRLLKIVRTLIDSWIHEIERWRAANQVACFEVLRERPRRRALQHLPSEAVNWLKLCNKLAANSNVI
jgi:Transposase DDE domain